MLKVSIRENVIRAATGEIKSELVFKNARYLNVFTGEFMQGDVAVQDGLFAGCGRYSGIREIDAEGKTLTPGFIDGHVHLESAVVTPPRYAEAVARHGTALVVADPHEIANVAGASGIDFMLKETENLPIDVMLMLPSCVPSTAFDENGATLNADALKKYLRHPRVLGLGEMMDYMGVIRLNETVHAKLDATRARARVIDGHAPGLSGEALNAYVAAGIASDHECTGFEEAAEKIRRGQWIMIREGTASKNLTNLIKLFEDPWFHRCLLVTDDKHPGELIRDGHIDAIIRKAISLGARPENAYIMATRNAAACFGLKDRGAICPGYRADCVLLNDVNTVDIHSVYKNGRPLHTEGIKPVRARVSPALSKAILNTIHIQPVTAEDFTLKKPREKLIGVIPGEILTQDAGWAEKIDPARDILKIAVVERHRASGHIGVAFVTGYGLKAGAIATSVAHDTHNIICVGATDEDIAFAVNRIRAINGGMTVVKDGQVLAELALPIAGLMCDLAPEDAQRAMDEANARAHELGVYTGISPFMTLSFVSLPVIPALRLTSLGVVDVNASTLL